MASWAHCGRGSSVMASSEAVRAVDKRRDAADAVGAADMLCSHHVAAQTSVCLPSVVQTQILSIPSLSLSARYIRHPLPVKSPSTASRRQIPVACAPNHQNHHLLHPARHL